MAEHVGDGSGEAERVSAEVAAFALLEAAEAQQAKAEDLLLGVQAAIRDLTLEKAELAKVAVAIKQSHQGSQEAIEQAIARFVDGLAEADRTVSGYVEAALERHQAVFAGALKEAGEKSIAEVQKVTEVAARETLKSLRQAAQAGQGYVASARDGVKAFQNRQWLMLSAAFMGGATVAVVTFVLLVADGGHLAKTDQEERIAELQKQHDQLRQDVNTLRPPARPALRPVRKE